MRCDPMRHEPTGADRTGEWAVLSEWLSSSLPLQEMDLGVLRERLRFVGRARASLAALEAELVGEVARREGDAAAEEILRGDQKRSRAGARKAVKVAAQLEWAPGVAEKLASGAITPEAAELILDAAADAPVDQNLLLGAAETEPDDLFRRTLKEHVNERTSEAELQERRERQRRRRRASISEQPDGMFQLFASLDPLVGNRGTGRAGRQGRRTVPTGGPQGSGHTAAALRRRARAADLQQRPRRRRAGGRRVDLARRLRPRPRKNHQRPPHRRHPASPKRKPSPSPATPRSCRASSTNTPATSCWAAPNARSPSRLRKRLVARDGGCIGCGAHEKICQTHHVEHWCDDGETSYENTCLLCWRCHHVRVHRHGEQITRHPNGHYTLGPPAMSSGERPSRPPPHHRHTTHAGRANTPGPTRHPPQTTR